MSAYPTDMNTAFEAFERKMEEGDVHPLVITAFKRNYMQLLSGSTGMIARAQIDPVENVPDAEELPDYATAGEKALEKTVIIKLNGGLGTSMGLEQVKSLLPVKDNMTFLDIIARQIQHLRKISKRRIPLLFMDSYNTQDDTLEALSNYEGLGAGYPLDFLQHRIPKVMASDFSPVNWKPDPSLEWCPPGHGDIFLALATSGLLGRLVNQGFRYAFVSNADNLGAVMDMNILGYFATQEFPFMMEVSDRTAADRKGGHLALLKDGRFTLRESAQCPEEEMEEFQDCSLFRYFNTNSLWISLPALQSLLDRYDYVLPLPLIRNSKTMDPLNLDSPVVYQMETAMGAAISLFERAAALRVPRSRFAPVKTTDDLLGLWSDAFVLHDDFTITANPDRTLPTLSITLDRDHYRFISQLEQHFPQGAPSLVDCASLTIHGSVKFGKNVTLKGDVTLKATDGKSTRIASGSVIEG